MENLNANFAPFVSTPLVSATEHTQMTPANIRQPLPQAHTIPSQPDDMEGLYPDIYRELYPAIMDAVNRIASAGYNPTPDAISDIVDNIIKNSGMWYEDEENAPFESNPEAVPVQFGFGRMPYRRRRRRHHNRDTLRDIVRILLLRDLFSGGHPYQYPRY